MNDARWQSVQDLFWSARELPAEARDEMLRMACGDDTALLDEVRRLLAADAGDGILDHTAPITPLADRIGDAPIRERVGPYLVTEEIGRGGMGVVYRAHDPRLRRDVALKFLPAALTRDRDAKSRFIDEARAASALDHPHNCPVYDIGSAEDGRLYIAMAYCAGGSLAARLASGPLHVAEAVRITVEVASALDRAHEAGIVHRDVKPANIAFTERGAARVLDFGVAVLGEEEWAAPRISAGTPAYMAPEQVRGAAVDRRTDVWALGAVLFEMLTGQRAFAGSNKDVMHAILSVVPNDVRALRPEVPQAVAGVVTRALEKDAAMRFASAAEMATALRAASGGESRQASPTRWRAGRLAGAAAIVAIVAIGGFAMSRAARRTATSPVADASAVAILPFRVSGEPSIAYLREGMVDLFAAKLTGEGGLRAVDPRAVLASWQRVAVDENPDLPLDASVALAGRVGAGNVLLGEVVGTAASLVVNASITNARGAVVGRATAQGAHTDLSSLVDRLVAQLLTASAGEEPQRLSTLTSTSLPALRAFLEGQAAYRRGRYAEAVESFGRAVDLDSTFALAGLGLTFADGWVGTGHARERGRAIAWKWRDRLSPRDRALLYAQVGRMYPREPTAREKLAAAEEALRLSPDRVQLWYELGDQYFHYGRILGVANWEEQAERGLRRALEFDSAFAAPLHHLVDLYARQTRRDDLRAVVNASRALLGDGATGDHIRWRAAEALGTAGPDSVALDSMATETLGWIGMISQDDGVGGVLGEQAIRLRHRRPGTRIERFERHLSVHAVALNGGRPRDALALSESIRELQPDSAFHLRLRVLAALFGGGDRLAGENAAAALGTMSRRNSSQARLNACVRELWQVFGGVGTGPGPGAGSGRRPSTQPSIPEQVCEAAVDAGRASQRGDASATRAITHLDELYGAGLVEFYFDGHVEYAPIALARALESSGNPAAALAAIRRRPYFIGWQPYLGASLRHEGRLAAAVGDREGAIRAYAHYLALRHDPEPELRAAIDSVRAELSRVRAAR